MIRECVTRCDIVESIKGTQESFLDGEIAYNQFDVMKLLNEAVERVRRQEECMWAYQ